jgi:hypothetical protein
MLSLSIFIWYTDKLSWYTYIATYIYAKQTYRNTGKMYSRRNDRFKKHTQLNIYRAHTTDILYITPSLFLFLGALSSFLYKGGSLTTHPPSFSAVVFVYTKTVLFTIVFLVCRCLFL